MTRMEELNRVLRELVSGTLDVEASALISEDGLTIASALPAHLDDTRVAGMAATVLNLGTRAAQELGRGELQEVLIRGAEGYLILVSAAPGALLLTLTTKNAKLGLVFMEMRRAAAEIRKML
jgi:uncharacterized protein